MGPTSVAHDTIAEKWGLMSEALTKGHVNATSRYYIRTISNQQYSLNFYSIQYHLLYLSYLILNLFQLDSANDYLLNENWRIFFTINTIYLLIFRVLLHEHRRWPNTCGWRHFFNSPGTHAQWRGWANMSKFLSKPALS